MTEFVKVMFELEPDEDGYPPSAAENVWAEPLGAGRFRLDNIPWYATGVAADDVIEARETEGRLRFQGVVERSGHSTLRVVLFDADATQELRDRLRSLGAESELSHVPGFISVDVPAECDMAPIAELLLRGFHERRWDVETGYLAAGHEAAWA